MFFSLKKLIPYNECFDLFLASTFYFFDIFNPVSLKGGVCGLYAYHKEGWNFFKVEKHCPTGLIIITVIANSCEDLPHATNYAKQLHTLSLLILITNLRDAVTLPILQMRLRRVQ